MATSNRPSGAIVDPGGVLLCLGEELRWQKCSRSSDQVLDDRTVEISMEICPRSARNSDVESRGHIPLGHASIDEWKQVFLRVHADGLDPISALIWAIDLPDGLISVRIGAVGGMNA